MSAIPGIRLARTRVFHGRKGGVRNAFRYGVDYVLIDVDRAANDRANPAAPRLPALWSVRESDHADGKSSFTEFAARVRRNFGLDPFGETFLLTQPRCLGFLFNPVSFWFFHDAAGRLSAVLAEVNNVHRDRHAYFCAHPDLSPIRPGDEIRVRKIFHVSPFQPVDGGYTFRFHKQERTVAVSIRYDSATDDGLLATLHAKLSPLTPRGVVASFLRFPFGAARVIALIYWQALKLKLKGAVIRPRPTPPSQEISR